MSKWEIFGLFFLTLINHNNCSAHLLRIFYQAPAGCDSVYAIILCAHAPLFLIWRATCPTRLRLWLSGQEAQQGVPPFATHTPFQQSETSAVNLCDGLCFGGREYIHWYWTVMVITFCFHQFLIGYLCAEILTAIVWRKSVKSWRAPIFYRRQYLWRFLRGGPVQQAGTVRKRFRP